MVIEKASGGSYFDYVRENIFAKAGMENADFIPLDCAHDNVAEGYIPVKNEERIVGWRRNIYVIPPYGASDGGAFTTADDLIRFMRSLRNKKLLGKEMTEEMVTPKVKEDDEWMYGYGFWFHMDNNDVIRYGHTGEDPGASARVYYYPVQDIDVVILGNQSECAGPVARKIHDLITKEL